MGHIPLSMSEHDGGVGFKHNFRRYFKGENLWSGKRMYIYSQRVCVSICVYTHTYIYID